MWQRSIRWVIRRKQWLPYIGATLLIMLPLLRPGFIFAPDMTFAPTIPLPDEVTPSYVFFVLLHLLNILVPAALIQKVLLVLAVVLPGIAMHRLMLVWKPASVALPEWHWAGLMAGLLYMVNPFVYSRFMTGQYLVLLGYGLLPLVVCALWRALEAPGLRNALKLSAWIILLGAISVHMCALFAVVAVASGCLWAYRRRSSSAWRSKCIRSVGVVAAVCLFASSYWLLPLLGGTSATSRIVASFSASDISAFAVQGDGFGRIGNVLSLQGFWADASNLYIMPQDVFSWWWLPFMGVGGLIGYGILYAWKRQRGLACIVIAIALTGTVLALSSSLPGISGLFNRAAEAFSAVAAFREPHKFAALLALAWAYFAGVGLVAVRTYMQQHKSLRHYSTIASVSLTPLPFAIAPLMIWGFYVQFTPRDYPKDWYTANTYINSHLQRDKKVLFLPWHLYMRFSFTDGITSNPGDKFFDAPVVISDQLEYRGAVSYFGDPTQKALSNRLLPGAASSKTVGADLRALNIQYVLLSKDYDYKDYAYLNAQQDLTIVRDTPTLTVYAVKY